MFELTTHVAEFRTGCLTEDGIVA